MISPLILWALVGIAFAVLVALGMSFLATWFRNKVVASRAQKIMAGELKNVYRLDGEDINIDKFKYKDLDGVTKTLKAATPQAASKPTSGKKHA
jgi:hypothetical protein